MSKTRALAETLAVSVIVSVMMCAAVYYRGFWMLPQYPFIAIALIVLMAALYCYVVFARHKEHGKLFILLTALFGAVIQYAVIAIVHGQSAQKAVSEQAGHPEGSALLVSMLLLAAPLLMALVPLVCWCIRKVTGLFQED